MRGPPNKWLEMLLTQRKMKIVIEGEELAIRKSKKDRQLPKDNRTNNDLQNTTQQTKDRATRTPLKTRVNLIIWKNRKFLLHWWQPLYYCNHYKQLNPANHCITPIIINT